MCLSSVSRIRELRFYQLCERSHLDRIHPRPEAKFLHLCSNNTVVGTQFHSFPQTFIGRIRGRRINDRLK
ncbi:hypothetical protein [Microseira wollei]|uniref:hypothetical protein n=1 Tax=Microseira wollei TaxID=467598 RepID=UPI001CFD7A27|nr:hypothetical protein [Microseira wollei]